MSNTKIRAAIVAALAVASVFAFTSSAAQAGTYTVNPIPCSTASPVAGQDGWSFGTFCGDFSAFYMQLNSTPAHPVGAPGTVYYIKYGRVRAGASITQLTINRSSSGLVYNGTDPEGTPRIAIGMCLRTSGASDGWTGASDGGCSISPFSVVSDSGSFTAMGPNNASCTTNCDGFQVRARAGATGGYIGINGITALVDDYTNPATSLASGNAANNGDWVRGASVPIAADSSDAGGGIKSNSLTVLSPLTTLATINTTCDYQTWNPCPSTRNWNSTFDSTQLLDGTYTARYGATDAGDRTATSANFSLKIDNTKPDTPADIDVATNGQSGWANTNDFAASWTNGAEEAETTTQSGIDAVIVNVDPTNPGTQSDPAPITIPIGTTVSGITATVDSIDGVTVPAEGAWKLAITTRDRAGNLSDVGAGTDPATDGQTVIGWDSSLPNSPAGQANGWISRDELAAGFDQTFDYIVPPQAKAPVCGFAGSIDKNPATTGGTTVNVPGGGNARKWRLPGTLDEDMHYVHLRAVSCNGTASAMTAHVEAPVDRTDPVPSIEGAQDGKWYQDGKAVIIGGSDVLSGMAPASSAETDSTKGAYLTYSINGLGPIPEESPRGATTTINVTGEGQKTLSFSPVDLAGNKAAATTVNFGIDATNPIGFIDQQSSSKPTQLSAQLGDAPSGVSYAIFQIRPASGGEWENLPTSLAGAGGAPVGSGTSSGVATARFPDTDKPAGTYNVRIAAFDQAGNQLLTQKYENGQIASVENPMRAKTDVNVKLFKALRTCTVKKKNGKKVKCIVKKCTKKSKGTCYRVLRGKVVLVGGSKNVTAEFKRGAVAVGVLSDENGRPLPSTELTVTTLEKFSGKARAVGTTTTDANGLYSLRVPAGVSRTVRVTYAGSETRRPASDTAEMATRAKMTLRIDKKRARTGQTVTFTGKVTPFDAVIPTGGKIVALQFYAAKKWRPAVAVAHTDASGKFKIKYKFDGARVKAKIIFRVVAPSEDGWGHAYSVSKPKVIRLNY